METYGNLVRLLLLVLSFLSCASSKVLLSCLSSGGVTKVSTSDSSDYSNLLYSTIMNQRFAGSNYSKPFAIILPNNQDQVSAAILCARKGKLTIRVRSGGHSYEGLSYTADTPFVIIDLRYLNRISIDMKTETAWVESGATLGELYYAISKASNKHGFTGGVWPTIGVGGNFMGGGYGNLARKYGVASDNVLDAVLVDAKGRILDSKAMGADVFWAIRGGGGGSWGAVTSWKIRLLPVPETVTVFKVKRGGTHLQAAKLWDKWQMVAPVMEDNFFLTILAIRSPESGGILQKFAGLYLGPKTKALESITKSFPELNVTAEDLQETNWIGSVVQYLGNPKMTVEDLKSRPSRSEYCTEAKYDFVRDPLELGVIELILEEISKTPNLIVIMHPYGGAANRFKSEQTAFPHRDITYGILHYVIWKATDDANSDKFISSSRSFYNFLLPFVPSDPRLAYVNIIDLDLGTIDWRKPGLTGHEAVRMARLSWGEQYFAGNYEGLVKVKTKIDPCNVFNHPQSIPPETLGKNCDVENLGEL